MRTTVNIDDDLLRTAGDLTGHPQTSALVRMGLEALIAVESGRRLARLGGSDPQATAAPRRRSDR